MLGLLSTVVSELEESLQSAPQLSYRFSPMVLKRRTLLVITSTCLVAIFCAAQSRPNDSLRKLPTLYELYSWRDDPNGTWNFCLLPSPSGVYTPAEAVFSKKFLLRGMNDLKREISKLPTGARIYWFDRILPETAANAKESQRLSYPPQRVIDEVQRYAETHHVQVEVMRASRELR